MDEVELLKILLLREPAGNVCKWNLLNVKSSDLHTEDVPLLVLLEKFLNDLIAIWLNEPILANKPEGKLFQRAHLVYSFRDLRFNKVSNSENCIWHGTHRLCIKL